MLILEFAPRVLGHKGLSANLATKTLNQRLLLMMPIIAGVGVLLSLLHQGSLGGVYGVLFARPFAWRPGIYIWPWTFILFILVGLFLWTCVMGLDLSFLGLFCYLNLFYHVMETVDD